VERVSDASHITTTAAAPDPTWWWWCVLCRVECDCCSRRQYCNAYWQQLAVIVISDQSLHTHTHTHTHWLKCWDSVKQSFTLSHINCDGVRNGVDGCCRFDSCACRNTTSVVYCANVANLRRLTTTPYLRSLTDVSVHTRGWTWVKWVVVFG